MHFKNTILLTTIITITSADPAPNPAPLIPLPVSLPPLSASAPSLPVSASSLPISTPAIPVSVPLGVPGQATSLINSVVSQAGATALPIVSGLASVPGVSVRVPVPTDLPSGGIPGLPIDPASLVKSITEVIQVLQLILSLLVALGGAEGALPATSGVGAGVQGALIASLVALAADLLPSLSA